MSYRNNRLRTLKSLLYSYYLDFKVIYIVFVSIMAGLVLSKYIFSPAFSSSESGSLDVGFVNGIITSAISMIVVTSNMELFKKFSFPVDRNLLVLSHIIMILVMPLVMLLTSCFSLLVESLLAGIASGTAPVSLFTWAITKGNFLVGFITSYILTVCITAVSWAVFAWFYRYKIPAGIILGMFLVALIYSESFRRIFSYLVGYVFYRPVPGILFLRLAAITLVSFALGYVPIKRMEVR